MAEYVNFKMRSGEDIIGVKITDSNEGMLVDNPIQVLVHPNRGFFCKSWMILSTENTVAVAYKDLVWCTTANDTAVGMYQEFVKEVSDREANTVMNFQSSEEDENVEDLEEVFQLMIESRTSTKH